MGIKKTPKLYRVELTGKDITTKLWYENKKLSGGIDGIAYWEGSLLLAIKDNILYWRDVTNMKFPLVLPDESEQFERLKHHAIKKFDSYNGLFAWVTSNGIVFGDLKEKQMEKILLLIILENSYLRRKFYSISNCLTIRMIKITSSRI